MKEVFKEHPSGLLVSNRGEVFVPGSGIKYPNGHYTYGCKNGRYLIVRYKGNDYYVHDLVVETFHNIKLNDLQVHHKNGNTIDNKLENLVALSEEEHREIHSIERSKPILQYDLYGNFIREWTSTAEIERQLGYFRGHISKCCKGKYKQAYGYIWKYKTE